MSGNTLNFFVSFFRLFHFFFSVSLDHHLFSATALSASACVSVLFSSIFLRIFVSPHNSLNGQSIVFGFISLFWFYGTSTRTHMDSHIDHARRQEVDRMHRRHRVFTNIRIQRENSQQEQFNQMKLHTAHIKLQRTTLTNATVTMTTAAAQTKPTTTTTTTTFLNVSKVFLVFSLLFSFRVYIECVRLSASTLCRALNSCRVWCPSNSMVSSRQSPKFKMFRRELKEVTRHTIPHARKPFKWFDYNFSSECAFVFFFLRPFIELPISLPSFIWTNAKSEGNVHTKLKNTS